MAATAWYILGFILIGLFTGLAMRNLVLVNNYISNNTGYTVFALLGLAGSLIGGMLTLLLFSYGMSYDYLYGETDITATQAGQLIGANSWLSLIAATIFSMLLISIYALLGWKRRKG
jgi:uncharacterized membrane protein YeaQ/YmgE (transglycosylase-associated protein family)